MDGTSRLSLTRDELQAVFRFVTIANGATSNMSRMSLCGPAFLFLSDGLIFPLLSTEDFSKLWTLVVSRMNYLDHNVE